MTKFVGTVIKLLPKTWDNGDTTFSIMLEGDKKYFRLGKSRYAGVVEVGNAIEFEAEVTDDKSAKVKGSINRVQVQEQAAPKAATPSSSGNSSGGTDWAAKDLSIQYQSARKDALEFLSIAMAKDAIKLPAKEAAKLGFLEAALDKYTAAFFADIPTRGAVGRVAETKAPAPVIERDVGEEEEE